MTILFFTTGMLDISSLFIYIVAQHVGAFLGAAATYCVYRGTFTFWYHFLSSPRSLWNLDYHQICNFLLKITVFAFLGRRRGHISIPSLQQAIYFIVTTGPNRDSVADRHRFGRAKCCARSSSLLVVAAVAAGSGQLVNPFGGGDPGLGNPCGVK